MMLSAGAGYLLSCLFTRKNGRFRVLCVLAGFAAVFLCLPVRADSLNLQSSLRTGKVAVSLMAVSDETAGRLQPNSTAPYRLTVRNEGAPAYIRVRFETEGADQAEGLYPFRFRGISEEAAVAGGCLYTTRPLARGESLTLCEGFVVPDLETLSEPLSFRVRAIPEALGDTGEVPDFTKERPWEHLRAGGTISAAFEKNADGNFVLTVGQSDLRAQGTIFSTSGELLPGDRLTETIRIANERKREVYGRIRLLDDSLTETERALLSRFQLQITRNGRKLYDNSLTDNSLKNGIGLGTFETGTQSLSLILMVPADLETQYADRSLSLPWEISMSRVSSGSSGSGPSGTISSLRMYEDPDASLKTALSGGTWILVDEKNRKWSYRSASGVLAKDGWLYLHNPYANGGKGENAWFKFSREGYMEYGWIRSGNLNWYYCSERSDGRLGTMQTGWLKNSEDGRQYYLDPLSGIMQTGWRSVNGKSYYFAQASDIPEQTWFYEAFQKTLGDTGFGKWIYKRLGIRSYGSMYQDEITPDGSRVTADGSRSDAAGAVF